MTKRIVLIVGSGPNAAEARAWPFASFTDILVINNAWQIRQDWNFAIYPEDFPDARRPHAGPNQQIITAAEYVPIQNAQGGFVYAGGTMAFTAGYWALGALRPDVMAFIGCDMVYPKTGRTHFYGTGAPDPLRADVTLQSLEAKSARLMLLAARQGCACINLSTQNSRLLFPRGRYDDLAHAAPIQPAQRPLDRAKSRERALNYHVPSGRYWEHQEAFDAPALAEIDGLWLQALRQSDREDGQLSRAAS